MLPNSRRLGVVAAGFAGGQARRGVEFAPKAIIQSGNLLKQLREQLNINIDFDERYFNFEKLKPAHDPIYHRMQRPRFVSAATRFISQQVYDHAMQDKFVLTLGWDHSIGIGSMTGIAKAVREQNNCGVGIVWVDAHADINTPESSPSGNIHGMPVAFASRLAREEPEDIFGWIKQENSIDLKKFVYIGIRDLDDCEKAMLNEKVIRAYSMPDINRLGIAKVMEETVAYLRHGTPLHLCFDIDAIDPDLAPSTGLQVPGGLTRRDAEFIAEALAATQSLIAMDVVEINPSINTSGAQQTIDVACSIVKCALGHNMR